MDGEPKSRLLALPPELRNRIYEFVFAGDHAEVGYRSAKPYHAKYQPTSSGILTACKQTNEEASDHFYFLTIFDFTSADAAISLLASLPPRYAKLISNLRLDTVAYFREAGIDIDDEPISYFAGHTQGCLFDVIHDLKKNGNPVPTKIEVCIRDWKVPEEPLIWTPDPWKTLVEIYVDIPDRRKEWYDERTMAEYRDYFKRTHRSDSECWDKWAVTSFNKCACPCIEEDNSGVQR